jgi:hypothetical protein
MTINYSTVHVYCLLSFHTMVGMHTFIHTHIGTYIYTYVFTYIHTYTRTHTHTHILTSPIHVNTITIHHSIILYSVSQNYVNSSIVEIIYSQNINDMCKMTYRTVSTCSPSCLTLWRRNFLLNFSTL